MVSAVTLGRAKLQSDYRQQDNNNWFLYRPDALPAAQCQVTYGKISMRVAGCFPVFSGKLQSNAESQRCSLAVLSTDGPRSQPTAAVSFRRDTVERFGEVYRSRAVDGPA